MHLTRASGVAALLLALTSVPATLCAQTSREEALAAAKAEKARSLHAYEPNLIERGVEALTAGLPRRYYPALGGLFEGAGFGLGVGYRRFLDDARFTDVRAVFSARHFTLFEASFTSPHPTRPLSRPPRLHVRLGWRDAPEMPFYGLGPGSASDRRSGQLEESFALASTTLHPTAWSFVRGEGGARLMRSGKGDRTPATLPDEAIPGLHTSPGYIVSSVDAGIDWRRSPGYSTRGGLYHVRHRAFVDVSDETSSFHQVDVEAVQLVPFVRDHWVLALRGAASHADALGDDTIPWFMLPSLGGSATLRAYPIARFRDRRTVLGAVEWRTFLNRALDLTLFYETGGVGARFADIRRRDLAPSYGVGLRVHGPELTALRVELAHGREGWRAILAFGPSF